MRKNIILGAVFTATITLLAGCSSSTTAEKAATATTSVAPGFVQQIAQDFSLAGTDAKTIIDQLDHTSLAERNAQLKASIRPTGLVLSTANGAQVTVPMPEDQLYVSFAPYEQKTHDCYYHSLTTCTGEKQQQPVHVKIVQKDGTVLVDEDTTTYSNGFIGFWLPRNIQATASFTMNGKQASREIDTSGDEAQTCVTDLQLV